MTPERVGAIVNPHAGGGDTAAMFAALADCLPLASMEARVTAEPAEVPTAVAEQAEWADLLVAIGGDGTVNTVATAMANDDIDTPLFVVPGGRGNSTYRHLYGTAAWREVARDLAAGMEPKPLDLGRVETEPGIETETFVLGFTAGLFRNALVTADRLGVLPGPLAYVLATAKATVVDDPVTVAVDVDGEPFFDGAARLVAVGGGRYRGASFELFPAARPGDGTLHLLVIEPAGVRGSIALTRLARRGRLAEHPAVNTTTAGRVTIRAAGGVPVEIDGTPATTPVEDAQVTLRPAALQVAQPTDR